MRILGYMQVPNEQLTDGHSMTLWVEMVVNLNTKHFRRHSNLGQWRHCIQSHWDLYRMITSCWHCTNGATGDLIEGHFYSVTTLDIARKTFDVWNEIEMIY